MSRTIQGGDVHRYKFPQGRGLVLDPNGVSRFRIEETESHLTVGWPTSLSVVQLADLTTSLTGKQLDKPLIFYRKRIWRLPLVGLLRLLRLLYPEPTFLRLDGSDLGVVVQAEEQPSGIAFIMPLPLSTSMLANLLERTANPATTTQVWRLLELFKA